MVTSAGSVTASTVILATNAYTDDLWPGLRRTVLPVQSYQVATRPLHDDVRRRVLPGGQAVSDLRRILFYFRLDPDGRLPMGGRGPLGDTPEPSTLVALERSARERFAMLGKVEWEHAWAGRIDMTLDQLPHLCVLAPGLTSFIGLNGRGIALTTTIGVDTSMVRSADSSSVSGAAR